MRLSVSLKVFLGFIAVVVAFGSAAIFDMVRSRRVQEDLRRLNQVYLRLNDVYRALDTRLTQLSELHRNIRDLIKTAAGTRSEAHINRYMPLAQRYRDKRLSEIRRIARSGLSIDLPSSDRKFLEQVIRMTRVLADDFKREDSIYVKVFMEKPAPGRTRARDRLGAGHQRLLRSMEQARQRLRQISSSLRRLLTRNLSTHVRDTAQRLEDTETRTLLYSIVGTLFALLVAVAMMLMAQFTLRPLRVLREGARVIGKGGYSHRVRIHARDEIGELAEEFNAMAGAIEEREHRLIETERKAARAERLATVGRAAAQITHEVRNPLSAIQLNAEMLEEELTALPRTPSAEESRALLSAIQREVDRLTEVTEAYLQFARLPRPRLEVDELGPAIQDVMAFVSSELEAAGVEVQLDLQELPPVAFDENLIRQALLNLIRNAREAMAGGGTLTVSARLLAEPRERGPGEPDKEPSGVDDEPAPPGAAPAGPPDAPGKREKRWVEVVIADTGIGMDASQIRQAFDPFFSTKETGTGLGLAITSQIIEEHGGTIWAEAPPEGGTRLGFTVPAWEG